MFEESPALQHSAEGDTAADPGPNFVSGRSVSDKEPRGESREWPGPVAARVLPDPSICRVKAAGFENYASCLVENPMRCPYALGFGFGFFCQHPQREGSVRRAFLRSP
jgi:hypothetical protein